MAASNHVGLVILRNGTLRLRDNPALHQACLLCREVVLAFCWAPSDEGEWTYAGTCLEVWIRESLRTMSDELWRRYKNAIIVLTEEDLGGGGFMDQVQALIFAYGVKAVFLNRCYEPVERRREDILQRFSKANGLSYQCLDAQLLRPPRTVEVCKLMQQSQTSIHRAYFEAWYEAPLPRKPVPRPVHCPPPRATGVALYRQSWRKIGKMPLSKKTGKPLTWDKGITDTFVVSEAGGWDMVEEWIKTKLPGYQNSRRRPDSKSGCSRVSGYYRVGNLSVVEVYWRLKNLQRGSSEELSADIGSYCRRLVWRDYAYWQLWEYPQMVDMPLRKIYQDLEWNWVDQPKHKEILRSWQKGKTGYPLIDAAMRELWITGYQQQNMRMVVAQFLVEVLGISWVEGARWFHHTLVDADLAINSMMWQNGGGSGINQWPDHHPVLKAMGLDPTGEWTRKWCPELKKLPLRYLFSPWEASDRVLKSYGVCLGTTYPRPVCYDIAAGRKRFACKMVECRSKHPDMIHGGGDIIRVPRNNKILSFQEVSLMTKVYFRGRWLKPYKYSKKDYKELEDRMEGRAASQNGVLVRSNMTRRVAKNTKVYKVAGGNPSKKSKPRRKQISQTHISSAQFSTQLVSMAASKARRMQKAKLRARRENSVMNQAIRNAGRCF